MIVNGITYNNDQQMEENRFCIWRVIPNTFLSKCNPTNNTESSESPHEMAEPTAPR